MNVFMFMFNFLNKSKVLKNFIVIMTKKTIFWDAGVTFTFTHIKQTYLGYLLIIIVVIFFTHQNLYNPQEYLRLA